jgi:hypothetical protein
MYNGHFFGVSMVAVVNRFDCLLLFSQEDRDFNKLITLTVITISGSLIRLLGGQDPAC